MAHDETDRTERVRPRHGGSESEGAAAVGHGVMRTSGGPLVQEPPVIRGLETVRLVGVGSAAAVWLVRRVAAAAETDVRWAVGEEDLPERFAVKVPHEASIRSDQVEARRRLRAELEAMRPLHHEYLVRAWGMAETRRGPGLLLDVYQAGSLYGIVSSSGGLTPGEMVTVLAPVAEGVAHLHRSGAVHGDIQPSNLLLAPDGRPALGDLGEAQLLGTPRSQAGAAGFLAPERWEAESTGSENHGLVCAEDVYALGAVAWFTLTGEAPAVGRARPPLGTLCSEVPRELAELLEDALSERPEDRPSAEEFAWELHHSAAAEPLDLSDHVDDEVVPELPTRFASEGVSRGPRRRRRLIGAAAGICLIGLAGVCTWSLGIGADDVPASMTAQPPDPEPLGEAQELLAQGEPEKALQGIATLRTKALEQANAELVEAYAASDSPAAKADAGLVEQMQEEDLAYEGDPLSIESLDNHASSQQPIGDGAEKTLDVVVTAADFETGAPVTQEVALTLRRHDGHWLLAEVAPL